MLTSHIIQQQSCSVYNKSVKNDKNGLFFIPKQEVLRYDDCMLTAKRVIEPSECAMQLYEGAFPYCERRTAEHHVRIAAENEDFYPQELLVRTTGEPAGILYYWHWPQHALLFIEHLAICPHLRRLGYGHAALSLAEKPDTCVILEIEPVVDARTAGRLAFYRSAGYEMLPNEHVQLPYHADSSPVPLLLLAKHTGGVGVPESTVQLLEYLLKNQVMC